MTLRRLLVAVNLVFSSVAAAQGIQPSGVSPLASAGEIHGKIVLSARREAMEGHMRAALLSRYMSHGAEEAARMAVSAGTATGKLSERAVVYIEGEELNRHTYPLPEKHPVLNQQNLQFHPQVLPILVGTTVDFPNRDNLFHNVFSYSEPKDFDLGRYPRDDSRSVTFDRPGTVRVYCDIHSHMNATILVLRHPFFAVPSDDGEYVIANIPPGKYHLVVWYDREAVERIPVEIQAGTSIEKNIAF